MARLRTIKPGFFLDEELAECSPLARILFAGLWTVADRAGRLEDRPRRIKAEVLPYDECDVDGLLAELADHGFIVRYEVDGARYVAVPTWQKHQNPHCKEAESTIPEPPHCSNTVHAPGKHSAEHNLGDDEPGSSCLGSCLVSCSIPPTSLPAETSTDNAASAQSGNGIQKTTEQEQGGAGTLEALRHNPTCEDRECEVRTLHVEMRSAVAEIVGTGDAGKLYNPQTPLHRSLSGMAGYICAACWNASRDPDVTMEDRKPLCRRALRDFVDRAAEFNRQKPIRSLPAFLRTRYANMTEAPVSDDVLAELRCLERRGLNGTERGAGPVPIGEVLADVVPSAPRRGGLAREFTPAAATAAQSDHETNSTGGTPA